MKHTKFTALDILAPLKELQNSWTVDDYNIFNKIIVGECTEEEAQAKMLSDIREFYPNFEPLEFASLKHGNTTCIIAKGQKKKEE